MNIVNDFPNSEQAALEVLIEGNIVDLPKLKALISASIEL